MIFLSSPYTASSQEARKRTVFLTQEIASELLLKGLIIVSPVIMGDSIAKEFDIPTTWEFWRDYCLNLIDSSEAVYVTNIQGWKESKGVENEINYAREKQIPVYLVSLYIESDGQKRIDISPLIDSFLQNIKIP